jgi:hypothetical protein
MSSADSFADMLCYSPGSVRKWENNRAKYQSIFGRPKLTLAFGSQCYRLGSILLFNLNSLAAIDNLFLELKHFASCSLQHESHQIAVYAGQGETTKLASAVKDLARREGTSTAEILIGCKDDFHQTAAYIAAKAGQTRNHDGH